MNSEGFSALLEKYGAYKLGKPQPKGDDFDAACDRLDEQINGELATEVRDFLRVCGGHGWSEVTFPVDEGQTELTATLGFVGGAYDVETTVGLLGDRLPKGCVPLAIDAGGNFACLDAGSGAILFWDHETAPENAKVSDLAVIADNLSEWLESWEAEDEE